MKNFWQELKEKSNNGIKPFFVLAPMADVTDIAFRQIIAKYSRHGKVDGGPDIFWTEFVSADGLASTEGRKKLIHHFDFKENERPIIAQIFGAHPENIKITAKLIAELGFDGIDINMGCPDKNVVKQGSGAAQIKNSKLAKEIILAAKEGAPNLSVSVKTRIGFNQIEYKEWFKELLEAKPSALTIHLRTKKEMSLVPAHWEIAKEIVDYVRTIDRDVVLLANGDVENMEDGKIKAKESGFEGIMIGRGIFGNPWLFDSKRKSEPTKEERVKVLIEHIKLFDKLVKHKNYAVMKKHFKAYINGFDEAKEIRIKLMETNSAKESIEILKECLGK